jgi:flagellar motor switch protein FliG
MVDMDWKAAMSSEVFREYFQNEVARINREAQNKQQVTEEDELNVLEQFKEFERQIRSSPKKLAVFRALQNKLATDLEYAAKVKTSFVNAVMMLDLS